jgi:hypothetical protein
MGHDDRVGNDPQLQTGLFEPVKCLLFAARSEKQIPGNVSRRRGASQSRVAVNDKPGFRGGLAARRQPVYERFHILFRGCVAMVERVHVEKVAHVVVSRRHPRWSKFGNVRAGILQGHQMVRRKAPGGKRPIARTNKDFHGEHKRPSPASAVGEFSGTAGAVTSSPFAIFAATCWFRGRSWASKSFLALKP